MNAALLGLGHPHSGALLATLQNLREIRGIYLWDESPHLVTLARARSRHPKIRHIGPDLEEVLNRPELDFAIVCIPHNRAAQIAQCVVAAGKHLLAEKPVGLSPDEVRRVQRAAVRAGVVASVLYPRRAHPCARSARRLLKSGKLGTMLSFEARFLATQVRFRDPGSWLFNKEEAGGGVLLWLGCHYLDLLQYVSGDRIVAVGARLAQRSGESIDVEDSATLTIEFRSGAIGTFHAGYTLAHSGSGYLNASGYDAYLAWNGRRGRVVWPTIEPRITWEIPAGRGARAYQLPATDSYAGAYGERFVRQFIAAVRGRSDPPSTLADALRTARIVEAAELSSRTGRFVRLP